MSIQKLDSWAAKIVQTSPLSVLKDATIGVDATYYLELRLNENKEEPLKQAIGGIPFTLKPTIEEDINAAKEAGITLLFIFNGLDFVNKLSPDSTSFQSNKAHENGWKHYSQGEEEASVNSFGKTKFPLESIYRYLQKILRSKGVEYIVAPYSAIAQLSYMAKSSGPQIDAILGSTDIFLFDIDRAILNWNSQHATFAWLSKAACEDKANRTFGPVFRDALLLLGSSFLPAFPLLERGSSNNKSSIADAIILLNSSSRNVLQLCNQYRDDPIVQQTNYADRYKKAAMTIRHHIVLEVDGTVAPLHLDHAPGDVHEFVGQRLPEELFFYISRGLLGTDIPNWLTSGVVNLTLPGGVLDSDPYRRLVIEQLNVLRAQALKIVAESLHYYYSNREINVKTWDGRDTAPLKIELKEFAPLKMRATEWRVKQANLPSTEDGPTLLSCLKSLKDKSFAQKTIVKGKIVWPALKTQDEVVCNVLWRFLQIRGYINDKHELTNHGIMLEAALSSLAESGSKLESGVIAIELLRLGLLTSSPIPSGNIPPQDPKTTPHTVLISTIACLGRLKHNARGYVGPVDRRLLSFAWMIAAVRSSLRNLIESVLTGMILNGDVDRDRTDWMDLPQELPFISDNGAALGVATKTYLDIVTDDHSDALKKAAKAQEEEYRFFQQVKTGTLNKSLDLAFNLFDAVYAGVKAGGKEQKDLKTFTEANAWLAPRR